MATTRFISAREVCTRNGWCRTTLWRRLRDDPSFPRPVPLGTNRQFFAEDEIEAWARGRLASRTAA